MKKILLAGSLLANAAFVFALGQRPAIRAFFFPSSSPAPSAPSPPPAVAPSSGPSTAESDPTESTSWAELTKGDLPALVARLRADGVPPRMVRLIVSALIAQHFADRHQAIVDAMTAQPWWQGQAYEAYGDPKITALRRQLVRDERNALHELLGADAPASDYDRAWVQLKYGNLSPDHVEKFRQLNGDYDDLMAEVRERARDILLPEDRTLLAFLEQEKRRDTAKLLTPDELLDFQLRSTPTAKRIRDQLAAFEPTEEEFRAIFKIQQAVDTQFGDGRVQNLTQEERRLRRDLSNATIEQVRAVLPADRFADYQLKTDPVYRQTSQFVAGLQLPSTATAQIVTVQKDSTARMQSIVADKSLTADQRSAQLTTLAQQATSTLTTTLGETGLAAYKQSGGNWLTNLEQRAQPRKK